MSAEMLCTSRTLNVGYRDNVCGRDTVIFILRLFYNSFLRIHFVAAVTKDKKEI